MSLCESIDTLAMAYLDDELVAEERRELELHFLSCAGCKAHVESERADLALVRKALAPPPAPPKLKVSIQRLLDAEDQATARAARRRWTRFALPGSATLAAAAALAVFVFAQPREAPDDGRVAREAVRQQARKMPLEVQGPSTGPWLQANFASYIQPPRFTEPGIELLGARLTAVSGHNAALLKYLVTLGQRQVTLTAIVIDDLRGDELSGGTPIRLGGGHTLHVHSADGTPAVTYVDVSTPVGTRMGYAFASDGLSRQELLELVVRSDLISRAQQGR
ncbi:MAG TPA: zf-HC2 domain-containing protein [Kofleriaceae bacterium]|nr:zf-HC2 domain-containing protein [Kofleriaceae bacterium]